MVSVAGWEVPPEKGDRGVDDIDAGLDRLQVRHERQAGCGMGMQVNGQIRPRP
ncbi:MAG: hypothetical protein V8T01_10570 [Oscillospiraceae bacterium]